MKKIPARIAKLRDQGAMFVVNHSGGKDSQAMTICLKEWIDPDQLIVIHSHLPGMEWPGIVDHIRLTVGNIELRTTHARDQHGNLKTFDDLVRDRGMFPSPLNRLCTSSLKRGPIERTIRAACRDRGVDLVVNCIGLRAAESFQRRKAVAFKVNDRLSKAGRKVYDYLPIHEYSIAQVFRSIKEAGQEPHWAYKVGASRLSCALCIMASKRDLVIGAKYNPEIAERLKRLEREVDHTMLMPPKKGGRPFLDELLPAEAARIAASPELALSNPLH